MKALERLIFISFCIPVLLFSQGFFENQFQEALQLYDQGRLGEAYRKLKALHDNYPDDLRPVRILGEIQAERRQWKSCLGWMEIALKENPDDMMANYYTAVAYRERGKTKALLQRRRDWNKSEKFFEKVITNSPHFRDVLYQYALLERYRDNFPKAIELGRRQLEVQFSDEVAVKVANFYASYVRNKHNEFMQWAQDKEEPLQQFYYADALRLDDKSEQADSLFNLLIDKKLDGVSKIPFYVTYAQCKIAMDEIDAGLLLFNTALDSIQSGTDAAFMFDHLKYIMSDQELIEYNELSNYEQQKEYFRKMLVRRDPLPANNRNMRLAEHLRRYNYAEEFFWYDGFRTEFSNPDKLHYINFPKIFELNDKFNDKGVVYIRHGKPDDIAFTIHSDVDNNESWLYWPGGSVNEKLMFHFLLGETQAGNNWRLIAFLPRSMVEARTDWDPMYARMLTGMLNNDELELLSLERAAAIKSSKMAQSGLNNDRHSWNTKVRSVFFPFYTASFLEGDKVRTELYYGLNPQQINAPKTHFAPDDTITVGFSVMDENFNYLVKQNKAILIRDLEHIPAKGFWPDVFVFIDDPGRYNMSINVKTPENEGLGGYKFRYTISDYMGSELKMSSLVLAKEIVEREGDPRFQKGELSVVPLPDKKIPRKKPLQVYFEIYNLPVGDAELTFQVEYKVKLLEEVHKNMISRITGIFRAAQPLVTNKVERYTRSAQSIEYISLDLSKNDPGLYELEVETTVPSANNLKTSRIINFELR